MAIWKKRKELKTYHKSLSLKNNSEYEIETIYHIQ